MARSREDIDRNDVYHRTKFVPADEVPGFNWLNNLGSALLISSGALLGFKFLSHRPSFYKGITGAVNELKSVPLVNEARKVLQFRQSVTSAEMAEFTRKTSSIFESKFARTADDMEAMVLNDLLQATKEAERVGDKDFVKFTLQGGNRSFKMAQSEYKVLEDAISTGVLTPNTRLGTGIYTEAGNAYDLRAFQLDRWLAANAKRVSKVARLPFLNFGPLDFTFTDLWAEKPFFVGMDLSKRGLNARKPFYIGEELYDITTEGIERLSAGANVVPTAGNMGYAYAQLSGIIDEQLYGARTLHRHQLYKHLDFDVFERNIYPDLLKDPKRHLKEAAEVWSENRELPFYLKWMVEKGSNIGMLADYSPMYARQEGWISSGSRLFNRWTDDNLIPVLLDPVQYREMSKIEQARDAIISVLGGETQHIKWITKQEASDLKSGVLEVADVYKQANKRVGQSQAFLAGIYKTRLAQDAGNLTGDEYTATRIRIPKYFAYDKGDISNFDIASQYVAERIQRLPEAIFGFGIRPSNRWDKQFLRQLTHIALPAAGIYYGINLASDILGGLTGGYGDPRKAVAHGAAGALLAKQAVLNATGISVLAHHFETVLPGSTDSLGAEIGFLGGGAYIGAKIGRRFGNTKAGIIGGLLVGAALAIGDPAQKVSTLQDELSGRKMVEVRKNKGWMLGRQDFKGDEIRYFRPHWYRRAIDQPGMHAKYGNAFNYWAHGTIPGQLLQTALTPLGIGNNYWLEEKGPWAHSYPVSNPMLQDVPFVGPLLEWTVGSVLKPYRYYVPEGVAWRPPYKFNESGLTYEEMRAIGAPPLMEQRSVPQHPFSFLNQIGNFLYNMEQYTGLIGWGAGMVLGQFNQGEQLESFHRLYGAPYRYYSLELGGGFGSCIVKGSWITTNTGQKNIEDVCIDDLVIGIDGCYHKVTNKSERPTNEYLSIKVRGIGQPLELTDNHVVPVYKRQACHNNRNRPCVPNTKKYCTVCTKVDKNIRIEHVHASEIEIGDYLLVSYPTETNVTTLDLLDLYKDYQCTNDYAYLSKTNGYGMAFELLENNPAISIKEFRALGVSDYVAREMLTLKKRRGVPIRYKLKHKLTEDLMYFFGWYIAEGNVDSGKVCLTCHANESSIQKELGEKLSTIFKSNYSVKIKHNTSRLTINSTELATMCKFLFGENAHTKHIPQQFLSCPDRLTIPLVKGLIDGDGYFAKDKEHGGFTSASKELTLQLQILLLKLGIKSSTITDYKEIPNGGYYPQGDPRHSSIRNYLRLGKIQCEKLQALYDGQKIEKDRMIQNGYCLFFVNDITTIEKHTLVYDLEVEDDHHFVANNIVVHNSEYLRRFVPKGPGKLSYYNTLPYPYPDDQMPGSLAKNLEDRTYPIDLYYGGPTKLPYGEVRLPGPGSEYLYNTGNDTIDDYLMLSYLTPGTRTHKDMRSLIKTWIKSGVVEADTARELGWAQYSISAKLERMRFKPLQYSTEFTEADSFYMDFASRLFGTNEIAPQRLPKDPTAREATMAYNSSVTGNEYADFDIPIFDSFAGSAWERITHTDLPIPMLGTMLTRKLIHNRTALEEYEYSRIYSNSFASWDSWFTSIVTDTMYNLGDMLDLDIKPGRVQKESDIIEYLDSIKYLKYRQLEQQALLYNQPQIAAKLAELSKQTIVGLDTTNPFDLMKSAFRSMPGPDKPFLKPFMFAPYSDRERILDEASPHMAKLLQKAWSFGKTKDYKDIQRKADMEAQVIATKYMRTLGPVSPLVWHPGYDIKRERIRMARQEALDIHRFGDWEMEEIRYNDGIY